MKFLVLLAIFAIFAVSMTFAQFYPSYGQGYGYNSGFGRPIGQGKLDLNYNFKIYFSILN